MIYAGVDPGKEGAIAFLDVDGRCLDIFPTPIVLPAAGKGRPEYDLPGIVRIFRGLGTADMFVTIEKLHPMPLKFKRKNGEEQQGGVIVNFNRGLAQGWAWMLTALGVPFVLVTPQTWQRGMLENLPGSDTGQRSILSAKRLWPNVDLRRSKRALKDSDGLADALNLAEWGRRQRMGGDLFAGRAGA